MKMEPPESGITTDTGIDPVAVGGSLAMHVTKVSIVPCVDNLDEKMVGFRFNGLPIVTAMYAEHAVAFAESLMQAAAKISKEGGGA